MTEEIEPTTHHSPTRWQQNKFLVMIGGSIIVALLLVAISMALYTSSGTAQLDLSRPGYQSVRSQVKSDDTFDGFPSSGTVSTKTLDDFLKTFNGKAQNAQGVDAFSGDAISDQALGIDGNPNDTTTQN